MSWVRRTAVSSSSPRPLHTVCCGEFDAHLHHLKHATSLHLAVCFALVLNAWCRCLLMLLLPFHQLEQFTAAYMSNTQHDTFRAHNIANDRTDTPYIRIDSPVACRSWCCQSHHDSRHAHGHGAAAAWPEQRHAASWYARLSPRSSQRSDDPDASQHAREPWNLNEAAVKCKHQIFCGLK